MSRAALEQALGVLRQCLEHPDAADAITALEAALMQPDWKAEYLASVARHNQTLDRLRDALAQPEQERWTEEQWDMLHFLYGAGEFDGVWFEQRHPTEEGAFWWRTHLRRLFGDAPQPEVPVAPAKQCWACGDSDPAFQAKCAVPTCEMRAPPDSNPWREAVEDELVVAHILNVTHADPRQAVKDAIDWHVQVALDPQVSSDAQALIDRGRALAHASSDRPPTEAQVLAAARVLNKIASELTGVNEADSWTHYGSDYLDDARAALRAAFNAKGQPG